MARFSIARSLRLALIGLAIVLSVVAAAGIASLYSARQNYEDVLSRSSGLATAVANLTSAGVVQVEILHDARGPAAPAARLQAAAAVARSAQTATSLATSDPLSARLVKQQIALQRTAAQLAARGRLSSTGAAGGPLARAGVIADELQTRQQARESAADRRDRSQSRHAITIVLVAGVLALLAGLALVAGLVRSMRRPLDELVGATGQLASGQLGRRVDPAGPRELRELGLAFNAMATDLADARERIEDERLRLAVTIESLGDGLLVTESGSSRIATVNPRAAELVPTLTPGRMVDEPDSPLPSLTAALEREVVIQYDGRSLAVTAGRLGMAGGVVWTLRDVTERSALERAKSEFVATASHELRSPLTSIKGFVELLEHSPGAMSERQLEFLQIIRRSTDRLVDLVNDLLDVARIEADHVAIRRRPIDIGVAVRELVELMGPRIDAKHQQLGFDIDPTVPLALADPQRIRQVIGNLLTNAHMYTPDGGRIHVGVEADGLWVKIVVADSGIGMSAAERDRAFERFYRARSGSESTSGTGLGLSIVKSLVDLHDGEIQLESEPGRGTTFQVLIPAAVLPDREDAELRNVQAAAVRAGRSRVLVVGRDELRRALEPALTALGVEHRWETSGPGAARVCGERRFEVALVDLGIRNPQAALHALDLRGRRLRQAVILFSDGESPTPSGIVNLGMEIVPVEDAAQALLSALRGDREQASRVVGGARDRG
jgi:signal transduction histidine kinase